MSKTTPSFLPSDNPRVPAAEHAFRHCFDVQTRFTDIDILGHVNNNVYLSMMDLAKLAYYYDIAGGEFTPADIRTVIVNVNCDFYAPSYFEEQLQVWTSVTSVGTRSFVMEQRVVDATTRSTKCICRTTMAGFDPQERCGADLDERVVAAVARFEERPELHIGGEKSR